MTITLSKHHLAIKALPKTFMAFTKDVKNYMDFSATQSRPFKDFLSTLDAFPNAIGTQSHNRSNNIRKTSYSDII